METAIFCCFSLFFIVVIKAQGSPNAGASPNNNSNTINGGNSVETSPSPVPSEPGSVNSITSQPRQPLTAPSVNGQPYGSPGDLRTSLYQSIGSAPSPARPVGSGYPLKQVGLLPFLLDSPRQASQALLLSPSGYSGQQPPQPQPGGYGGTGGGGGYGNQGNNQAYVLPYGMTSSNTDSGYGSGGGPGQHAQLAPGSYLYFGPPYTNLGPATGSGGCCGGNAGGQSNGYIPGGAAFVGNGLSYNQGPGGALPGCGSGNAGGCGGQTPGTGYGAQNQNVGGGVIPGGSGCTNPNGCPTLPGQGQSQYPGGIGSGCSNPAGCQTVPGQTPGTGYGAGNVVPGGQGQYPGGTGGCTNPNGCPTLPGQNQNIGGNYPGTGAYNDDNGVGEALWSEWSPWGACRVAQYRSRTCSYSDTVGQNGCRGKSYESQKCSDGADCLSALNAPCNGQQGNSLGVNDAYGFKIKRRFLLRR